jgi:glycosyltransferase involved in cell wall biosynthesis
MKIAILSDGLFPIQLGGMQKHTTYLTSSLAAEGVDITLYHPHSKDSVAQVEQLNHSGIKAVSVSLPRSDKFPGHYIRQAFQYSRDIFNSEPNWMQYDLIYCQGFTSHEFANQKRKGSKLPLLLTNFHGLEMFQPTVGLRSKLQQLLFRSPVRFCLKHSDYAVSLGGGLTKILSAIVPEKKIIELPNAIDHSWITHISPETAAVIRFVFVGRFEKRKGIHELNKVLSDLRNESFHFDFVGPVPSESQLKDPRVTYHGSISDQEKLKTLVSKCDVLVSSSYSEGMPTVILEAMSCGLAILATDVGAVNVLVSEDNGMLIRPRDIDALKSGLIEFVRMDKEKLLQKKRSSLTKVRSFTWTEVAKKNLSVFRSILAR